MSQADPKDRTDTAPGAPRVGAIAALLGASIALSRVIGYLREAAIADQLGAGGAADAYYAAFQLPDILNYMLAGGALSIAFVPLYTRVLEREGQAAASRLFATVLGTVGAAAALGTVVLWWYADAFVSSAFGFEGETRALAVRLTRIVLPGQFFFFTGGIVRAVLMARGRFGAHALAPLVYNIGIIAGGLATGSAEGFAWGVLLGAVIGPFLIPVVDLWRSEPLRARVAPFDPDFRRYLWLALPLMLGFGLTTVDEWYERFFGSYLAEGTVAQLSYARKLMQAPVGVIGQAFAVAAMPTLAQLFVRGDRAGFDRTLGQTLRTSLGLSLLAAAALWALATPLVELLYRHGAFTAQDAQRVAYLLVVLSFAVPGWVVQQVAVRAFFAREQMWRPMLLNSGVALAALPLYLALSRTRAAVGLAEAGVIAISVNALATLAWTRVRHGGPELAPVLASGARAAIIAAGAGVASVGALNTPILAELGLTGAIPDLVLGGCAFAGVAALGIFALGDDALRAGIERVLGGLLRRLRRRSG